MDAGAAKQLQIEYQDARLAINQRLTEFAAVPRKQYFYELLYCLLTPQSSAAHAFDAKRTLTELDFQHNPFDPESILRRPQVYVRFHKTKALHLLAMKENFSAIDLIVTGDLNAYGKREWLADNVLGLSHKEATHFLRNIGKNESLAILDRHILKHLLQHDVIAEIPRTLTKRNYLEIEEAFQEFAEKVCIPINALDLLFWSSETGVILKQEHGEKLQFLCQCNYIAAYRLILRAAIRLFSRSSLFSFGNNSTIRSRATWPAVSGEASARANASEYAAISSPSIRYPAEPIAAGIPYTFAPTGMHPHNMASHKVFGIPS